MFFIVFILYFSIFVDRMNISSRQPGWFCSDHLFAPIWRDGLFCSLRVCFLVCNVFQYWCEASGWKCGDMDFDNLLSLPYEMDWVGAI